MSKETDYSDTPRVWITSLRDYNEGKLVGEWLDLTDYCSEDEVLEAIGELLKSWDQQGYEANKHRPEYLKDFTSFIPREEWAVHDYEGFPERFYSESMGFEEVLSWIEETQVMDEDRKKAYEIFANNYHGNVTVGKFEEAYRGHYRGGMEEYAEELFEEIYDRDTMKALGPYIDYERVARSLQIDGYFEEDGHVFTNE